MSNRRRRVNPSRAVEGAGTEPARLRAVPSDAANKFYWELKGASLEREHAAAWEDEGYLANDLIRGAQFLRTPVAYEPCPNVVNVPGPDTAVEAYTDAIAAILQVAAWNGLDAAAVARAGLDSQRSLLHHALHATQQRRRREG